MRVNHKLYLINISLIVVFSPDGGAPIEIIDKHERYWSHHDPAGLVSSLTWDNLKKTIKENPKIMAMFYDPDTITFKALRPNFLSMARLIGSYNVTIN